MIETMLVPKTRPPCRQLKKLELITQKNTAVRVTINKEIL